MGAKVSLVNGSGVEAKITDDQELIVNVSPYPARREQKIKPFRQFLTDDGTASGSNDMSVVGSTASPLDFYVEADQDDDRYISALSFIISYSAAGAPYQWANAVALLNGIQLFYVSSHGDVDIHEGIKSNQDMFRLQGGGVDAGWEIRHVDANNDYGYFITVPLGDIVPPYGIKLDHGRTERLIIRIKDDVTAAQSFNCIAYGFDRFEE